MFAPMKCLLSFLMLVVTLPVYSQEYGQQRVDSILNKLSKCGDDTAKANVLYWLSLSYVDIEPVKGIQCGREDSVLAEKLHWKKGGADAAIALGENYTLISEYALATSCLDKALSVYQELHDNGGIARAYCNAGILAFYQFDFVKAMDRQLQALELAERIADKDLIARCCNYVGLICFHDNQFRRGFEYERRALAMEAETGNLELKALSQGSLGYMYYKDKDSSLLCFRDALKLNKEIGNARGQAYCKSGIGAIYLSQGKDAEGLDLITQALEIDVRLGEQFSLSTNLGRLSGYYLKKAKDTTKKMTESQKNALVQKVIEYAGRELAGGMKINNKGVLFRAYRELSEANELRGNFKDALTYYKAEVEAIDSVFNNSNDLALATLELKREHDLKEKQVEINKIQEQKKRNEQIFFVCGLGLLLVVTVVLYRNYSLQKSANRQKDVLISEIHHRVKNNLQVVSSLLSLQSESIADVGAKAALAEGENRLNTMAIIHQKLYLGDVPGKIDIAILTDELFNFLDGVYRKNGNNVRFVKNMQPMFIDNDTAVPLGLILNELITNSYKHAFGNNTSPEITLTIEKSTQYCLSYSDNGDGLPVDYNFDTCTTLGLKLVNGLVRQIRGRLVYAYQPGASTFTITFG